MIVVALQGLGVPAAGPVDRGQRLGPLQPGQRLQFDTRHRGQSVAAVGVRQQAARLGHQWQRGCRVVALQVQLRLIHTGRCHAGTVADGPRPGLGLPQTVQRGIPVLGLAQRDAVVSHDDAAQQARRPVAQGLFGPQEVSV